MKYIDFIQYLIPLTYIWYKNSRIANLNYFDLEFTTIEILSAHAAIEIFAVLIVKPGRKLRTIVSP